MMSNNKSEFFNLVDKLYVVVSRENSGQGEVSKERKTQGLFVESLQFIHLNLPEVLRSSSRIFISCTAITRNKLATILYLNLCTYN
jgi:hypothetical protein